MGKKHTIVSTLLLFFLAIGFCACKNKGQSEAEKMVQEWVGKTIQFPEDYQCHWGINDTTATICNELFSKEYKVLLYVDSMGCTECRLKLLNWKQLIEESATSFNDKLNFLFFFQPKSKKEISLLLNRDKFDYPVFIDMNGSLNRLNQFPATTAYQCFLLDKNNKVVLIGNPTTNPKIWELYKQMISGEVATNTQQQPLTSVSIQQQEITLTDLQKDKTSTTIFRLTNTGNQPLLITHIDSSCGCTVPTYDKQPVEPGKDAEIKVEITPGELGAFHKTIRVYCNTEKGVVSLAVKGMVEQ
ncbi:hypothetical protein FACS1894176_10620 [Bacteroidia bacterium]|nr:hypothetical protein FACS1894176_10620 [Bacteroidia bacterium]